MVIMSKVKVVVMVQNDCDGAERLIWYRVIYLNSVEKSQAKLRTR